MNNIQRSVNPNTRGQGSYSGKTRAPTPPSAGSSSKAPELPSYKNSSSFLENSGNKSVRNEFRECENNFIPTRSQYSSSGRKNEQGRIFHVGQYSKSNSENNLAQQSPRAKQKQRSLPLLPRIAADWFGYPYLNLGASAVGNTYPRDCPSIEIVPGWQEGGCGVTCVSMITGLSYKECRDKALAVGGFTPEGGMFLEGIADTFSALGVNARMQDFKSWNDLPDLAVLAVSVLLEGHAVVFKRKNGNEYIFDRNEKVPLSPRRFKILEYRCVAIPAYVDAYPEKPHPRIVLPSGFSKSRC